MSAHSDDSDSSSDDETYAPPVEYGTSDDEEKATGDINNEPSSGICKKDVDDLWKSFKSDNKKPTTESTNKTNEGDVENESDAPTNMTESKSTITVTKVYDFAGEEVRITKEVGKESKEAKDHLKMPVAARSPTTPLSKLKRPGGLQGMLGKLGKKPKLSTLEKSKLDWQSYKEETGIHEELKSHNKGKDGYLEKQMFLERTDYRQFEKERDFRQAKSKR